MPDTMTAPAPAAAPAPSAPAPSTPAPSSAPAPSTSTETTPTPSPETTPQTFEEKVSSGWEKAKADAAKLETETPAEEEPAEAPAEPAEPAEAPAVEEEPAEAKEETPAEEPEPEFTIDMEDGLAPDGLSKALSAEDAAGAKAWLDANPEIKNAIFGALRRDSETREIRQIFPTAQDAKMASQAAGVYTNLDTRFLKATSREGAQDFLNSWAELALVVDDKGQPVMKPGPDGKPKYQFHPALENTFNVVMDNRLAMLEQQAKLQNDERLQTALEIIREHTSPQSPALDNVPEELKPYADSLKQREDALRAQEEGANRQRTEQQQVAHDQSVERAESTAAENAKAQLKPLFAKAGLSDFESQAAIEKIGAELDAKLEANPTYQMRLQQLMEQEPSPEREKAHKQLILSFAQQYLGPIASKVISAAKGGAMARQTARQEKIETQVKASKTEPKGTTVTPITQQPAKSPKELSAEIKAEYARTHNGDPMPLEELTREMMKRSKVFEKRG